MAITCCNKCVKRHELCHSTCSEYIQQKAEHDKKSRIIKQARLEDSLVSGQLIRSAQRAVKRRKSR